MTGHSEGPAAETQAEAGVLEQHDTSDEQTNCTAPESALRERRGEALSASLNSDEGLEDYSQSFSVIRRRIGSVSGTSYRDFVRSLTPRYAIVWRDVALGYAALAITLGIVGLTQAGPYQIVAVGLGALSVGYWIAYLQLFRHEAAHYNVASSRRWNDRLCDIAISWQVGQSVGRYRPIHFDHHRLLGTPEDTERSYFNAITPRFLFETLTGLHAVRVLLGRRRALKKARDRGKRSIRPVAIGLGVHLLLCAGLISLGLWSAAAAWVLGVGMFYPFFATLRQVLEHRSEYADPEADYRRQPHGAVTRLFGDDLLSRTLGGAGFNRHLLHHWEPQVSYTRLAELENFLEQTELAQLLQRRRSSYWDAFIRLLRPASMR